MAGILRQTRTTIFIAVSFAAFWGACAVVGGVLGGMLRDVPPRAIEASSIGNIGQFALRLTILGGMTGLAFAGLIAFRSQSIRAITPGRAGLWGSMAGALVVIAATGAGRLNGAFWPLIVNLATVIMLSAASALLFVGIARWLALHAGVADALNSRGHS